MKLRYRLFLRRKSVYYAFDDTTKTFTQPDYNKIYGQPVISRGSVCRA